MATFEPQTATF